MSVVNPRTATFLGWFCIAFSVVAFTVTMSLLLIKNRPELIGASIATLAPIFPGVMILRKVRQFRK